MNYRHAFHAGNHADVLKHVVLLAICDALTAKPAPCFALDTHAGAGVYRLQAEEARRTAEADDGIGRLLASSPSDPLVRRYLDAVAACRIQHGADSYPGSPWLLAHALRQQDRIACCELEPGALEALRRSVGHDPRVAVHARDGYGAFRALLPPRIGAQRFARGLVLVDPPYEAQQAEFDAALAALREGLARWPQGIYALWYPIKQRRTLHGFLRKAGLLQTKSTLVVELLVRADDSPLRMNGSGLLLLDPPWQLASALVPALRVLQQALGDGGASTRVHWLREQP
ncbi:23S rRNA (adenine(2030)-N(6))-methyltransferase RlmJ [Luteimonas sp. BDR2-5]|uniref:23S rRNA (adenine(2030)-N(6))-methyltransferase RlmJ n=1 Tax=Proluteimonas luteida TaxID=2878685 RepID=UPI001E5DE9EF|nr:23S rRNA (adenine(2030)-N(6))-methyltransferase RlmJ [Luteimonas sp. BDR2-5]MCD9027603.1 23S rRNA (adenine(2030)-N(6))-methyltransferase RlmJ [Luteimonas sp. BDR2-5]